MVKRPCPTTHERYTKLTSLGKRSYISQSGIATLLDTVQKDGLPEASSRSTQYRARKHVCGTETPYGKLVHEVELVDRKGKLTNISMQNPLAMLYYNANNSIDFAAITQNALRAHPCDPSHKWNIVIYQDGVNPSDGLSKNQSRKSCVFYWSFLEFGMRALAHEEVWFTPIVVRQEIVNALEGQHTHRLPA